MTTLIRLTGKRRAAVLAATFFCTWATFSATLTALDLAARPVAVSAGAAA